MRRLAAVLTLTCALAILAAGCASPASRFYTLSAAPTPATTPSDLSVAVGPVSVPAAVDRPEIVVRLGPNQVKLDEFNRWASPLQNNIARVVAENLVALLGTPRVTLSPQTLSADADYRAAIEVQGFDSAPGEAATLEAVWTVRRTKDGKVQTGRTTAREPAPDRSYDALAAAHSRAVARLSQDIADAVRALNRPDGSLHANTRSPIAVEWARRAKACPEVSDAITHTPERPRDPQHDGPGGHQFDADQEAERANSGDRPPHPHRYPQADRQQRIAQHPSLAVLHREPPAEDQLGNAPGHEVHGHERRHERETGDRVRDERHSAGGREAARHEANGAPCRPTRCANRTPRAPRLRRAAGARRPRPPPRRSRPAPARPARRARSARVRDNASLRQASSTSLEIRP